MFNKKAKIDPSTTDTLIGEGSTFEGKIRSQASIRLEGEITGDLECEGDVIVGEKGVARSNVAARNIILAGKVYGNIFAKGKLTIKSTGYLAGNLSVSELAIESGGFFKGNSQMEDRAGAGDAKPEPKEAGAVASASLDGLAAAGSQSTLQSNAGNADMYKTW